MLYLLGEAALRTALLAGILQLVLFLLRVRQARLLLATWTIVLATSLTMPLLLRSNPLRIPLDDSVPRVLIDSATDLMQQPSMAAPAGTSSIEAQIQPSLEAWLEIVYTVVACGLGLRVLLGVGLSLRILARATPAHPEWVAGLRVRLSQDVAGPVTIARSIVLPMDFAEWPAETRHAVLAHEYAHVSRMDYAMLVVSQLNRAVFWFSPPAWWLHRRLVVLTELVSDDRAIEVTHDRVGYAEILLEMAQRSGPKARGPSMARVSTLPLRIDRILLDQSTSRASRLHWATLTFGVVAVSLMVANLAPSIILQPVSTDSGIREATVESPTQEARSGTLPSPENKVFNDPIPSTIASTVPTILQARLARPRPAQVPTKTMPHPPIAKGTQEISSRTNLERRAISPKQDGVDNDKAIGRNTKTTETISGGGRDRIISQSETSSNSPRSELDRLNGSTCVGTVAIGMGAYYSGGQLLEPDVTAGQVVPVKAQFFRKADNSSWVRFGAFGRPLLDLKVQPTRTGVTWTGEYGITYAVQEAGGDRLVGLAAKIAHDSAILGLTCTK